MRSGEDGDEAADQGAHAQPDERHFGVVVGESSEDAPVGKDDTGAGTQDEAANKANCEGKEEIGPFGHFRFSIFDLRDGAEKDLTAEYAEKVAARHVRPIVIQRTIRPHIAPGGSGGQYLGNAHELLR